MEKITAYNAKKAQIMYDFIDQNAGFCLPTAERESSSMMNVIFRLANEFLEEEFVTQALKKGLGGLEGHKSVGGCRTSIYNAVIQEAVNELVRFMTDFMKDRG